MNRWTKVILYDDGRDMLHYTPTEQLVRADLVILRRESGWMMLVDTEHLVVSADTNGTMLIYYRDW
jgi:hypothetical protein